MDDKQKEIEELKRQRDEFRLEMIIRGWELQGMAEEKDELVRERDALAARSEQLSGLVYWLMEEHGIPASDHIQRELFCFPTHSLNRIKAQVEEETVERCVALIQDDPNTYRDGSDIALENMPRKYAKQAGSTVEEGE